ncbi:uncharacterized protein G2W53_032466 [Senna tora]|uniref:Uncharacterized protein n=1 Tax=Senna tora TaxID=362788 RepID=A0A834W6C3_9FABA|nr:uncharacterized protein G2W53_032466 [Senna tora]
MPQKMLTNGIIIGVGFAFIGFAILEGVGV